MILFTHFSFHDKCLIYLCSPALKAELQLDSLKQKGAVKRTLFFDYHQSHHLFPIVIERQKRLHCQDFVVYLRVSCLKYSWLPSQSLSILHISFTIKKFLLKFCSSILSQCMHLPFKLLIVPSGHQVEILNIMTI